MKNLLDSIRKKIARIAVFGLGYVGLPTALAFSSKGFKVIGVDINEKIVSKLNRGESHIPELNLEERLKNSIKNKRFIATTNGTDAVRNSDITIICVPTPIDENKNPDLSYVYKALSTISKGLSKNKLIILESTVYPTFCECEMIPFLEKNSGLKAGRDFGVSYVPERYNPGDPEHTVEKVTRIVGSINDYWLKVTVELYKNIVSKIYPVKSLRVAEAAKIIENVQRDLNIALMNELALIFERLGIDVFEVIKAAATKWNFHVYYPGAGVGGECLPADPYYLVYIVRKLGFHPKLILAGRSINDYMPIHLFELINYGLNKLSKPLKNSKIVILGLSYKANVGDFRLAPSKTLIKKLYEYDAKIYVHDPFLSINEKERDFYSKYATISDPYEIFEDADAIVLVTDHDIYREIDWVKVKKLVGKNCLIVDGRGFFDYEYMQKLGYKYIGIGRKFF